MELEQMNGVHDLKLTPQRSRPEVVRTQSDVGTAHGDAANSVTEYGPSEEQIPDSGRRSSIAPFGEPFPQLNRSYTELILKHLKTTKEQMCANCSALQLSQDKFIIQDHSSDPTQQAFRSFLPATRQGVATKFPLGSGSGKYRLGKLVDIEGRSSTCPLCRLVRDSLTTFHGDNLHEYQDAICFASWQVDGREVQKENRRARPRTRRIQLRWSSDALEDSYLVLIAPETARRHETHHHSPWESTTLFLGRNITSAGNNQALAKRWLDLCNSSHGPACHIERGPEFDEMISSAFFGVVDVHEMRLTALPKGQSYAALSYMWGDGDSSYTTLLSSIQTRQNPGELGKIFSTLPKVIQDAINLVRGLGLKYIWVDSLCIVQDSDRSWQLNSSNMDLVYGNADLTICAADGGNASEGLKGVSLDRIITQHSEKCGNIRLVVSHLAETYVRKSRWNSRAWTFQERLLSKRCLIFAGERVFFQCRSAAMSEDIVAEQKDKGWSIELVQAPLQLLQSLPLRAFWVYMECVRLYTSRELSRQGDILAAFQGMSNLIGQKLGYPLIYGLPSSHFDLALLWEPTQRYQRRKLGQDKHAQLHGIERKQFDSRGFPSWSWCGWTNTSMEYQRDTIAGCLEDVHQWHNQHTWINWYIRDAKGNLRLIWDRSKQISAQPQMEIRWHGYGMYGHPTHEPDQKLDPFGRVIRREVAEEGERDFEETLPDYPYRISISDKVPTADQLLHDHPLLQFWTWSAFLRVIPHEQTENNELGENLDRYDIADYSGDWCGTIVLDDGKEWRERPGSEHEFIAISEAKEFGSREHDNWSYYIPQDPEQSDWSLFYVLLIKRRKGGIAQRVGLGKVFKIAFQNSCLPGSMWKEIILA